MYYTFDLDMCARDDLYALGGILFVLVVGIQVIVVHYVLAQGPRPQQGPGASGPSRPEWATPPQLNKLEAGFINVINVQMQLRIMFVCLGNYMRCP